MGPRFSYRSAERTTLKKLLEFLCGLLAGSALFAIMALTFFDVLGRKFASNSIPGSLELTELLMVVVIFAALPLVSRARRARGVRLAGPLPARLGAARAVGHRATSSARPCCWGWAGSCGAPATSSWKAAKPPRS